MSENEDKKKGAADIAQGVANSAISAANELEKVATGQEGAVEAVANVTTDPAPDYRKLYEDTLAQYNAAAPYIDKYNKLAQEYKDRFSGSYDTLSAQQESEEEAAETDDETTISGLFSDYKSGVAKLHGMERDEARRAVSSGDYTGVTDVARQYRKPITSAIKGAKETFEDLFK